jgi:hypothetical protein
MVSTSPRFCTSPTARCTRKDSPKYSSKATHSAALSEAVSQRLLEGKRVVFDAAKPADEQVELTREKPRKRWVKKPLTEPSVSRFREPSEPVDSVRPEPFEQRKSLS